MVKLTETERAHIIATANEFIGDIEAMLRLPRIGEQEWTERFGELPSLYDDQTFEPLEDTKAIRTILEERDPRLVWSEIEIARLGLEGDEDDADSTLIVPGYWPRGAGGWRLTTTRGTQRRRWSGTTNAASDDDERWILPIVDDGESATLSRWRCLPVACLATTPNANGRSATSSSPTFINVRSDSTRHYGDSVLQNVC